MIRGWKQGGLQNEYDVGNSSDAVQAEVDPSEVTLSPTAKARAISLRERCGTNPRRTKAIEMVEQ